jgi:group I intron endonuclease
MGYIYKITNTITKKCYIGVTTKENPNDRWMGHKQAIKSGRGCPLLRNAFTKYGETAFKFEVLIICFDEDLYSYEKQYIKKYNSLTPNGYNAHEGGEFGGNFKGKKHSEEAKQKMALKTSERNKNEELIQRIREGVTLFNRTHNIGELMRNSEKWKKAKAEGRIGGHSKFGEKGEEIRKKISEGVKRYYKNIDSSVIKTGPTNKEKHSEVMTKAIGRKVLQYSLENTLLSTFDSIILASKATGVGRRSIQANMAGRSKTSGGFVWKYAEKEPKARPTQLDVENPRMVKSYS